MKGKARARFIGPWGAADHSELHRWNSTLVSADAIPGFMEAMTMPYSVRDAREMAGLKAGMLIDFDLVVENDSSYAEAIHEHKYQGLEPDPLAARRLKLLNQVANPSQIKP